MGYIAIEVENRDNCEYNHGYPSGFFIVDEDRWNVLREMLITEDVNLTGEEDHSVGAHSCIIEYDFGYLMSDDAIVARNIQGDSLKLLMKFQDTTVLEKLEEIADEYKKSLEFEKVSNEETKEYNLVAESSVGSSEDESENEDNSDVDNENEPESSFNTETLLVIRVEAGENCEENDGISSGFFVVEESEWNLIKNKMDYINLRVEYDHSSGAHGCITEYNYAYLLDDDCIVFRNISDEVAEVLYELEDTTVLENLREMTSDVNLDEIESESDD
jgi:hypothetical protein